MASWVRKIAKHLAAKLRVLENGCRLCKRDSYPKDVWGTINARHCAHEVKCQGYSCVGLGQEAAGSLWACRGWGLSVEGWLEC